MWNGIKCYYPVTAIDPLNNNKMCLIRLGNLYVNKKLSTLLIDDVEVPLEPKLLDLLLLFCQHQTQIIDRQLILDTLWPNSIVTDNAVNKLVASLRKVLQDDPKAPKYIQTVPKRGYRLLIEAKEEIATEPKVNRPADNAISAHTVSLGPAFAHTDDQARPMTSNQSPAANKKRSKLLLLGTLTILVAVAYLALLWRPSQSQASYPVITNLPVQTKELTRVAGLERSPLISHDQSFLLYLKEDLKTGHRSLWHKDLNNEQSNELTGLSPYLSRLVTITKSQERWQLMYLAQESEGCEIGTVEIQANLQLTNQQTLLDCTGLRVFDVSWQSSQNILFYSAKAEHESSSQIYQFDVNTGVQSLITQPKATGAGNRGIDVSPDGEKLLIVQLDKTFKSQLYVLDITTNQLTSGFNAPYNLEHALWTQDSKQILYFSASPSRQILLSDIDGKAQRTLFNVSDYLETEFSRIGDTNDIVFSTINLDFNNRWVNHVEQVQELSNSTVYDMRPTLAHQSFKYAFVSTRSGQEQIYYGDLASGQSRVLSRLKQHRWLKQLSFSPNDEWLLTADLGHVWLINVAHQLGLRELMDLSPDNAVIMPTGTLLSAIWLNDDYLYYKSSHRNQIRGFIYHRNLNHSVEVDHRWQTLLTDHKDPDTLYMIDPVDTQIYQMPLSELNFGLTDTHIKFPEQSLQATGTRLPQDYFDLKLHDGKIYYVTASNSGNARPYDFQIEVLPILSSATQVPDIYKTSCSCGFDVADSGFMISELVEIEGDIHRTQP